MSVSFFVLIQFCGALAVLATDALVFGRVTVRDVLIGLLLGVWGIGLLITIIYWFIVCSSDIGKTVLWGRK